VIGVVEWDEKDAAEKPQDKYGGQCKRGKATGKRRVRMSIVFISSANVLALALFTA
jgi:hypothetical protein